MEEEEEEEEESERAVANILLFAFQIWEVGGRQKIIFLFGGRESINQLIESLAQQQQQQRGEQNL